MDNPGDLFWAALGIAVSLIVVVIFVVTNFLDGRRRAAADKAREDAKSYWQQEVVFRGFGKFVEPLKTFRWNSRRDVAMEFLIDSKGHFVDPRA